jgi:hypothetical protein
MNKVLTELDKPWEYIVNIYFEEFMVFFFPEVHQLIDWNRGYEFMEKELQKILFDVKMDRHLADKLVKVWLKDDKTLVIYIHIDVRLQKYKLFAQRMFINNYRLFDLYGPQIWSLAILGDLNSDWRPKSYTHEFAGFEMSCNFPIIKLIDYQKKWDELEKLKNPFAMVVRTHLKRLETGRSSSKRLFEKIELFKALSQANYSEQKFLYLFDFIDWVLALPKGFEWQFHDFVLQYESENQMQYVTSIEKLGIEKGIQQGALQNARDYVIDTLKVRFKRVPKPVTQMIQTIDSNILLANLHREAILTDSLEAFRQRLSDEPQ